MKTKQEILVNVLSAKLENAKVGVIVRGITDIDPVAAIDTLSHDNKTKYYVSAVGYSVTEAYETDMLAVSHMIEDAVRWRSEPTLAGKIVAFVKSDSDISREMKRSGVLIQQIQNSDKLILDVPRLNREMVSFSEVIKKLPTVDSPEKLYFPLGRTPEGKDIIKDISELPHLLVGGSTGSGKTVFLFTMLAALLKTHPTADELQIVLSSSGLEDFIHFEGIPHLVGGKVISDAEEATELIKSVVFTEFERREKILTDARVANIAQYNQKCTPKLAPMVVVIDEFADLADQLETKKEKEAFFTPVKRIAQIGRKRGIHLVLCTQRPAATLVPSNIKSQISGRLALRVNDANSSRMILEEGGAQYLQKHGDMIYKNGAEIERAQGYFISIDELDEIVEGIKQFNE